MPPPTALEPRTALPTPPTSRELAVAESEATPLAKQLNLIRELAVTQFKLKYTGSALGYVWSLVKPLMLFGVMYAVFAKLLGTGGTTPRFPFQLLLGVVIWTFFVETVGVSLNVVVANTGLIKKASFSRPVLVFASSVSAFMTFIINLTLVIVVGAIIGQVELSWASLAIVPLVAEIYLLIIGLSLFLAAVFVYFRDLGHVWEILTQVLFFGSAVVYPLSAQRLGAKPASLLALNPVAQVIEDARHVIVTPEAHWTESLLSGWTVAIPFAEVIVAAVIGYWTFKRLSPGFAEYL